MMRNLWIFLLVLVLGVNRTAADYSGKDAVEVLTPKNFQQKVLQSSDYWLVEFYAPWCGHCKQLEPEWKSAAKKLQNKVRLGAVNADEHKDLAQQYGIKGFPTIKEFGSDKKKPIDYQGGRTAADIIKYVESNPKIKNMVSSSAITVLTYKNVFTFLSMGEEQRSRRIPSILLFGKSKKKKSTPPTWLKSIAGKLQKTETKKARASVGFIPGSEAKIAKQFKLSQNHLPAIVFVNVAKQTYIVESPKKLNQKFAEDFIKKNLRGKTSEDKFMALPNFPGPDVPKKKPGYKYKKLGPSEAANCFILKKDKKTKKKMCVILVSQNCNKADAIYNLKENDAGNLKSLAKHYRRDPFRFYWLCEKDPLYTLLNDKIFENKLLSNGNSNEVIALKTGKNPRFSVLNELKSIDGGKAYLDLILEGSVRFTRITAALPDFSKVDGIKNEKVKEDNHIEL